MPVNLKSETRGRAGERVVVEARNFNALVALTVALIPDSGDPVLHQPRTLSRESYGAVAFRDEPEAGRRYRRHEFCYGPTRIFPPLLSSRVPVSANCEEVIFKVPPSLARRMPAFVKALALTVIVPSAASAQISPWLTILSLAPNEKIPPPNWPVLPRTITAGPRVIPTGINRQRHFLAA